MKGDSFPENKQARAILCKYGIDPYRDCENLVISRNYCHSKRYAKYVLTELQKADNEDATAGTIASALKKIAAWHKTCGDPGDVAETTDEL